jgi:regulator of RNase E activity RraA
VGFPVAVAGVTVTPGDIVIGDADGVVVVPQADLDRVIPRVKRILGMEEESQKKIRGGFTNLGGIEDLLKSDQVRYVD